MRFHAIVHLSEARVAVGIVGDNEWAYSHAGRILPIATHSAPFMVTILERGPHLHQELRDALEKHGLDSSLADSFPAEVGVRMGLTWGSEYWESLALRWVEHESSARKYQQELHELSVRGATQRVRHSARRLARTIR